MLRVVSNSVKSAQFNAPFKPMIGGPEGGFDNAQHSFERARENAPGPYYEQDGPGDLSPGVEYKVLGETLDGDDIDIFGEDAPSFMGGEVQMIDIIGEIMNMSEELKNRGITRVRLVPKSQTGYDQDVDVPEYNRWYEQQGDQQQQQQQQSGYYA